MLVILQVHNKKCQHTTLHAFPPPHLGCGQGGTQSWSKEGQNSCKLKVKSPCNCHVLYSGTARGLTTASPAPRLRVERGTRLPNLSLTHKAQIQPRRIQETICALHWWSNSWPRERTFWREGRRQMYNLESFACSWHELQWLPLFCTRTRLVPKQNDQELQVCLQQR